jgi:hypothetical protein
MARTGVTQDQVFAAAETLVRAGERPSIERVRALLGTGSPNTVLKLLDQWWSELGRRLSDREDTLSLPGAPAEVADLASTLWNTALHHAKALAENDQLRARNELTDERVALAHREATMHEELQAGRRELEQQRQAMAITEARLVELQRLADQQATQLADVQRQRDRLFLDCDAVRERAGNAEAKLLKQMADAAAERQALEAHQRVNENRWSQDVDRARQEAIKLQARVAKLEQELGIIRQESLAQQDALRASLRIAEREQVVSATKLAACEAELERLHHRSIASTPENVAHSGPKPSAQPRKVSKRG